LIGDWGAEDEEHDNARAALAWARETGDLDRELQLAAAAGRFYWPNRGLLTEGRRRLEDVLGRSDGADETRRAVTMVAAAHFAWRQGDPHRSDALAAAAQPVLERVGDDVSLAAALMARAIAAEWRGDLEAEATFYDEAERLFREMGNKDALAAILNNRAYAEIMTGKFDSAERRLRELAGTSTGNARLFALANHGLALARLGRLEEAAGCFAHILRALDASNWTAEIELYGLEGLATIAGSRGEDLRAARLWGASAAICEATGYALAAAEQQFHQQVAAEVRRRLGEDAFDRAWNEGRRLSGEQAVKLALIDS